MRPSRSTAPLAVVAVIVALLAFQGPWWARGAPTDQATTPAAPPAAAEPAKQDAAQAAAVIAVATPAPTPAPAPAPAPPPAPKTPIDPNAPLAGANVTVYLRADAVGIQFTGANMEFRNLATRKGTFVRCDDQWLVIKNESQEVWVPRTSIAMFEVR